MSAVEEKEPSTQEILGTYQNLMAECRNIATKIGELNLEKDEHRLVIDTMSKLDSARTAYRLVGGVLVERTTGEILPAIQQQYDGISTLLEKLDETLKTKEAERKAYKEKYGIMTQEEKENLLKRQARESQNGGKMQLNEKR
jgi:prefoldin subunit 2